jgi:hypothetical protein
MDINKYSYLNYELFIYNIGKSNVTLRYVKNRFSEDYQPTL